jgi:heme/copper-type cytochrome/quinol oxidase subunit 2
METLTIQVLKIAGRWFVILILLTQSAFSQEAFASSTENTIWHNALFLFSVCFFVAGFIFMFMVKVREEKKHQRHTGRLSHRHH